MCMSHGLCGMCICCRKFVWACDKNKGKRGPNVSSCSHAAECLGLACKTPKPKKKTPLFVLSPVFRVHEIVLLLNQRSNGLNVRRDRLVDGRVEEVAVWWRGGDFLEIRGTFLQCGQQIFFRHRSHSVVVSRCRHAASHTRGRRGRFRRAGRRAGRGGDIGREVEPLRASSRDRSRFGSGECHGRGVHWRGSHHGRIWLQDRGGGDVKNGDIVDSKGHLSCTRIGTGRRRRRRR